MENHCEHVRIMQAFLQSSHVVQSLLWGLLFIRVTRLLFAVELVLEGSHILQHRHLRSFRYDVVDDVITGRPGGACLVSDAVLIRTPLGVEYRNPFATESARQQVHTGWHNNLLVADIVKGHVCAKVGRKLEHVVNIGEPVDQPLPLPQTSSRQRTCSWHSQLVSRPA